MSLTDDTRSLEELRRKLLQLCEALNSTRRDVAYQNPLPTWPSLQTSQNLLNHHITTLSTLLSTHRQLLDSAHPYPLPSFPDRNHENVIGQLLRKRLEPEVEDWIDDAHDDAVASLSGLKLKQARPSVSDAEEREKAKPEDVEKARKKAAELEKLWEWAGSAAGEALTKVPWGMDYTVEELDREGGVGAVKTGLKRKLVSKAEEDEDEDDEDSDIEDEAYNMDEDETKKDEESAGPPLSLEQMMQFMLMGTEPAKMRAA